ncbi:M1 family metallopeptidase [Streptomyces sp. NPDC005538]|uniref:M1 family metallopeptidase n=1 Tax=unclassified Streptomyces TaxID=2593676 RepID=UPI0033BF8134
MYLAMLARTWKLQHSPLTATVAALALFPALAATTNAYADTGRPGAQSAGERLFPTLGNGGYDARSYHVSFDYRPGTSLMRSQVVMRATATQSLSRFSLDSVGQTIHKVTVDGRPATFKTNPRTEKLVITPSNGVNRGRGFVVRVDYTADRSKNPVPPEISLPPGVPWPMKYWVETSDGFALLGQPDRAHLFFPSNDVPSDKARFTFSVTTPKDVKAVANGDLVADRPAGHGRTTYTYRTRQPLPTDITQVAVGHFRTVTQRGPHGLPVKSYVPADQYAKLKPVVSKTPDQIAWLEKTLGLRYPFERYGVLAVNSDYDGVALETGTLSTFGAQGLAQPASAETPIMVHELTHQFFGDAVSVHTWDDMWLSEGHARFYQARYAADQGYEKLDAAMHEDYVADARSRAEDGPAGRLKESTGVLFSTDQPGALMLYGLRNIVGQDTFQRIERTFFATYQGRSASTQDYIDVANRVSGRNLTAYFDGWLYGSTTPPMPGHPDWKPGPAS